MGRRLTVHLAGRGGRGTTFRPTVLVATPEEEVRWISRLGPGGGPRLRHMPTDATELTDHWWWRPGWQVGTRYYAWHVTFEDQPTLCDLIARHQEALRPFSSLDVIPRQWLHMTMHGVGHVSEVSDRERAAVLAGVRSRLAALDAVPITFQGPGIDREGVAIGPTDVEPMRVVHRAVTAATAEVIAPGREAIGDDIFWPHVSLAYANATAGTREIRAALDAVDVGPVTTTVRQVTLIEMHRDHQMYEWRTIEHVRLGRP